jgi:Fe-S cluster biogenesis protein NfuA/nitrite reductase/ring-hydroxylating ferredoxin subunit
MNENKHRMNDDDFQKTITHLDQLIRQFEELPLTQIQEKVFEMLRVIDLFHRESLGRLVSFLREQGLADHIEQASTDSAIRTLLVLYDLLPGDPLVEAEKALDSVRPYIHSHGGEVELLRIEDGIVHLRLSGACSGCAGSTMTLRRGIEAALREKVPGYKGVENHEEQPQVGKVFPGGLISFDEVETSGSEDDSSKQTGVELNSPVFKKVARLEEVSPGKVLPVALDNRNVLIINVGGEIYATGAECPGTNFPITYGKLEGHYIICPWHKEVFDIRNGKPVDKKQDSRKLPIFPVAIVGQEVRLAINVSPVPIR